MSESKGTGPGSTGSETVVVDAGPVPTEFNGMKVLIDGVQVGAIQNWKPVDKKIDVPVIAEIAPKGKIDFAPIKMQRIQPDRIYMNQQDFDDILQWGAAEGLVVNPEAQRLRNEAKKVIEESDDPQAIATAYEVMVMVPEHKPRDFGVGAAMTDDQLKALDATIKDIQAHVDAEFLAAYDSGAVSISSVCNRFGLSLDEENEAMKKEKP